MSKTDNLAKLVKDAREKNNLTQRQLADMCDISHTEIYNIEKGERVKPALLTLKGFEKYLGLEFKKTAKLAGYSDQTINFGEQNIIVSYEMYDKLVEKYKQEQDRMLYIIDQKRHFAMDVKEYFNNIHKYLLKQDDVDKDILKDAEVIERLLNETVKEYKTNQK